jgi:hypothetical protein
VEEVLRGLARKYCVRLYFNKKKSSLGQARYWARSISIKRDQPISDMVSVFFHELGHIHCHDEGKWRSYHNTNPPSKLTERERRLILRTGLRAERWIDKWASSEMAKHFPGLRYTSNYGDKATATQFLNDLKIELCQRK